MAKPLRIGVDLMGGDESPELLFQAVLQVGSELEAGSTVVVLTTEETLPKLEAACAASSRLPELEFLVAEEVIEMEDAPLLAVRRKKNSSMALGMQLLAKKQLDGLLSTGNTGALVAFACRHLSTFPGIERPALLIVLPAGPQGVVVLDVGANVSCQPHHLADFAKMGIVYRRCVHGIETPTVGLLNIGVEEEKGTKVVQEAYQALSTYLEQEKIPFLGNVEGRVVFRGEVDVLVTDGFTGNVFLKTCEGVAQFFMETLASRFRALHHPGVNQLLGKLMQTYSYSQHPGAVLCGVEGLVIKCHGDSNITALKSGLRGAFQLARMQLVEKMGAVLKGQ